MRKILNKALPTAKSEFLLCKSARNQKNQLAVFNIFYLNHPPPIMAFLSLAIPSGSGKSALLMHKWILEKTRQIK
jgi:hypothetical protein